MEKIIKYLYSLLLAFKMKLKEGEMATNFELSDKDGEILRLFGLDSRYVVIYFYPKDDTPGCVIEASDFSNKIEDFEKLGVKVIGISGGDNYSKKNFCEKYGLRVKLLSDSDFKISKRYGVYGEKSFMGKDFSGINRVTFVLDKNKKIIKTYGKVRAKGHAQKVLDFIKNLER